MKKNRLKETWQAGGNALNGWLSIPSSWSAELMAHQGWDTLTVDMQHGLIGYDKALPMLQAISTTDVVPLARIPWNDPAIAQKMLDAGAMGLICPMVNTREECERFVHACRYFPDGHRSLGPTRARIYAGADYTTHANDEILTMAMIETETALKNMDEIMSVPGLDAVYVGPNDLGRTLGASESSDYKAPELVAVLESVVAAARRHGIAAGLHCGSQEYAVRAFEMGFQFATVLSDGHLMARGAQAVVDYVKGNAPKVADGSLY